MTSALMSTRYRMPPPIELMRSVPCELQYDTNQKEVPSKGACERFEIRAIFQVQSGDLPILMNDRRDVGVQ